jgi:hypothetical protein
MSQHDAYLDRMTARLAEIEHEIRSLAERGTGDVEVRELEAALGVARERLQLLRRAGADLDDEMTRSFAQSFERLNAAVGRARGSGRPDAA